LLWNLHQFRERLLRDELAGVPNSEFARVAGLQEPLKADFCCTEGQFVVDGVESGLLFLNIACLSDSHSCRAFLERVDAYLLLLFGGGLGSFFREVNVFEMLHFAVHDLLSQPQPNIAGHAEVVDAPADCVSTEVPNLRVGWSFAGRKERRWG
jgi:hypothetical protein